MAAKKLVVELLDGGAPASGVSVKASGCSELETGPSGQVFFLVDEPQIAVTVGGQEVYQGTLESLPARLTLNKDGGGWKV